jgi:adenylate cyclase
MKLIGAAADVRLRTRARVKLVTTLANVSGALFVFGFMELVAPSERNPRPDGLIDDVTIFVPFMLVSIVVMLLRIGRMTDQTLDWLQPGQELDIGDRQDTLALPFRIAVRPMTVWSTAALMFGAVTLSAGHTWAWSVQVAATIVLGGAVSCAISFLMLERALRPVFSVAFAGRAPDKTYTMGVRPRLLLAWALGSAVPLCVLALLPLDALRADERTNIHGAVVTMAIAGLCLGLGTTLVAARSVSDPLKQVRDALASVQQGDLSVELRVSDAGEIGQLQGGVNEMVAGLRERQRVADLFGCHVGAEVARQAIEQGSQMGGELLDASVLFVDLIGSTALAEVLSPQEVVRTLNAFFDAVVRVISAEGGWVNKFQGDGALCVFGAPSNRLDHATRALRSARALRSELAALDAGYPGLHAAIGVSCGLLVAGNVGTELRYEYTVVGSAVNEASRLTDLAKGRGGRTLCSAAVLKRAGAEEVHWHAVGTVVLRGCANGTSIFEPSSLCNADELIEPKDRCGSSVSSSL